jgi:phosphoesterase RecJ-like protein
VIVDTNDPRRLGKLWGELSLRAKKIVFLDHHPDMLGVKEVQYPPHALLVSDPQSSSIGELLYRLFHELELSKINTDVALGLYVSVMTDTNSFRYARTTPLAHRIAAEMIELKVNPEEVYQAIYSSKEVSHVQLLGKMLQNVRVTANGKVAWLEMDLDLRRQHQASADDTQSFLNLLLIIKDTEVVCFFREEDSGQVRVSIKSKGRVVVNQLAMDLGGGGHEYAAGLALQTSLSQSVKTVISKVTQLVQHQEERK